MLGLLLSLGRIPFVLGGGAVGLCMMCACAKYWSCCSCRSCTWRRCCFGCCKRCLRCVGWDKYDDFELMLYVHEASFEKANTNISTKVRIVAGYEKVETEFNNKGSYQESFQIRVDQGTEHIRFDLLDSRKRILADVKLDVLVDVLGKQGQVFEKTYLMNAKKKTLLNPKLKVTLTPVKSEDVEPGLLVADQLEQQLGEVTGEQQFLLRQQLQKAQIEADEKGMGFSHEEVLKQACSGPIEIFGNLGRTRPCFAAVLGPPRSRRWALAFWDDEKEYNAKKPAFKDVDILKIMGVQADPSRGNVFFVTYADENRVKTTITLQRVDRAREVWVEMLKLVITRAHEVHLAKKKDKKDKSEGSGSASSQAPTSFFKNWSKNK